MIKDMKMETVQIDFLDIDPNDKYTEDIYYVVNKCFETEGLNSKAFYINIILTDLINIRLLNKKYRNIDKETDVLSFPMFEKKEIMEYNKQQEFQNVLGDIVICIDKVKEQANEYNHSFKRELSYMIVHGFYHLLGYDHMQKVDTKQMREKEENILNALNIKRG